MFPKTYKNLKKLNMQMRMRGRKKSRTGRRGDIKDAEEENQGMET